MARNVKDTVVEFKKPAGRRGGARKKPPAAAAALFRTPEPSDETEELVERAPAFGSNEPDAPTFLQWVKRIGDKKAEWDAAKLTAKTIGKQHKSERAEAAAAGVVMGELDRALEDAQTEQVDLDAKEQRYLLYMEWLGCPINLARAKPGAGVSIDPEADAKRWFKRGDADGRRGLPRQAPDGCPPERAQDYYKGHEAGQELLMRGSPLTASAFGDKASKASPAPVDNGLVTFTQAHFMAGTELEEANLKSLLPGHHEAFHEAVNVVAVFGSKRRILKEPGYQDDGDPETEITEPETVPSPSAAELA